MIDAKMKEDKEHNDSFEKYYNKDLDLDEGKCQCQFVCILTEKSET